MGEKTQKNKKPKQNKKKKSSKKSFVEKTNVKNNVDEKDEKRNRLFTNKPWKNVSAIFLGIFVGLLVLLIPYSLSTFYNLGAGMSWMELIFAGSFIGCFIGYYLGVYAEGDNFVEEEEIKARFLQLNYNNENEETNQQLSEEELDILVAQEVNDEKRSLLILISIFFSAFIITTIFIIITSLSNGFDFNYLIGIILFLCFFFFGFLGLVSFEGKRKETFKNVISFISTQILWLFFEAEFFYQWAVAFSKIGDSYITKKSHLAVIWIVYVIVGLGSLALFSYFFDLKEKLFKKIGQFLRKVFSFESDDFRGDLGGNLKFVGITSLILIVYSAMWICSVVFIPSDLAAFRWIIPLVGTILIMVLFFMIYIPEIKRQRS